MIKILKAPLQLEPFLGAFRDLFTKPSYSSFRDLSAALSVCDKSKTVANLCDTMADCREGKKARSSYNWFFSDANWDENEVAQRKLDLFIDKLSLKDYIWKIMVFRYFNQPLTFEYAKITYGWRNGIPSYNQYNEDEFAEMIQGVRDSGGNPFTNAYLINSMAAPGKTRDYCYTRLVIPHLHKNLVNLIRIIVSAKYPEEIIAYLKTFPSVSDFIAHELYQDLTYIAKYTDRKIMKFDQNDFTNVGPGASLGIRLIFPSLKGNEQKQAIYYLKELAEEYLSKNMNYLYWNKETSKYEITNKCNITLHQIEMWLCEFQKYWKMSIGEGKQRSKFKPRTKNE